MIWFAIIICGMITFIIRFIPLSGIISYKLSPSIKKSLEFIPLAVLSPIIINDLSIIEKNELFIIGNFKLYAGLLAVTVAIISNNILATISIGMACFLIMSNLINI